MSAAACRYGHPRKLYSRREANTWRCRECRRITEGYRRRGEHGLLQQRLDEAGRVDNTLLREAFLASGVTATEVARRCGWMRLKPAGRRQPDRHYITGNDRRVATLLGVKTNRTYRAKYGRYYTSQQRTITIEDGALIARAIGVAPVEVGL